MSDTAHIRRVEFFLAFVSFALLAATSASSDALMRRASRELDVVAQVLSSWNEQWLDSQVGAAVDATSRGSFPTSWRVMEEGQTVGSFVLRRRYSLRPSRDRQFERMWPHWMSENEPAGSMASPFGGVPVSRAAPPMVFRAHILPKPRTLTEFGIVWDHLHSVDFWRVDAFVPKTLFVYDSPYSMIPGRIYDHFESVDGGGGDTLDLCFRDAVGLMLPPPNVANWTERDSTWHFFHGLKRVEPAPADPIRIALAASARQDSVALRREFIRAFDLGIRDEPFAAAFSHLVAASRLYPGLPLDTLQVVLAEAIAKSESEVQLVGARVPRVSVAILGIGLLLLVQLYYVACIRLLRYVDLQRDAGGWIGAYPSQFAQILSAFGAIVLPVAASVVTLVRSSPPGLLAQVAACLLTVATLIVGVGTVRVRLDRYRSMAVQVASTTGEGERP